MAADEYVYRISERRECCKGNILMRKEIFYFCLIRTPLISRFSSLFCLYQALESGESFAMMKHHLLFWRNNKMEITC